MLDSEIIPSTRSTRAIAAQPSARSRRWAAAVSSSLSLLACAGVACGGPAQLDLGSDEKALETGGSTVVVDPSLLQATIVDVSTEGVLCPPGSVGLSIATARTTATVILSQSVTGVQSAGCKVVVDLDVPEGLALGMPTTILRGVALGGRTVLDRRYSFDGAGASDAFTEQLPEDFVLADRSDQIESRSCEAQRRVQYTVDVTAQLLDEGSLFQLDSVDLDTTFRFGTGWRFCDPNVTLEVSPGQDGDFCDGPNERVCAEGLSCDRERDPNAAEGLCVAP